MKMLTPVRTAGSPNTPAIWLLALVPLLLVPLQVVGFYAGVTTTNVGALTFGLALLSLTGLDETFGKDLDYLEPHM